MAGLDGWLRRYEIQQLAWRRGLESCALCKGPVASNLKLPAGAEVENAIAPLRTRRALEKSSDLLAEKSSSWHQVPGLGCNVDEGIARRRLRDIEVPRHDHAMRRAEVQDSLPVGRVPAVGWHGVYRPPPLAEGTGQGENVPSMGPSMRSCGVVKSESLAQGPQKTRHVGGVLGVARPGANPGASHAGTGDRTRTYTPSLAADFESAASTIPPHRQCARGGSIRDGARGT